MTKEIKNSEYSKKEFEFISQIIWGFIHIDREWAEETSLFKIKAKEILDKYPMLDKSI